MNRETYDYSKIESVSMNRSTFNRRIRRYGSTSQGYLTPFFVKEILPGDTAQIDLGGTVRQLIAPKFPVMDHVTADVMAFFVPNRLVWNHWKEFMGPENNTSAWVSSTTYHIPGRDPCDDADSDGMPKPYYYQHTGSLWDKFNLPTCDDPTVSPSSSFKYINALPFRGYKLIWNEWFRSEALQAPVLVNMTDTALPSDYVADSDNSADISVSASAFQRKHPLLRACKLHDRFTSGLPSPQAGVPVSLFSGLFLPVSTTADVSAVSGYPEIFAQTDGSNITNAYSTVGLLRRSGNKTAGTVLEPQSATPSDIKNVAPVNLWASFNGSMRNGEPWSGLTVNDFRASFAMQKVLERSARSGLRYVEFVRAFFGCSSPDSRMQRTEYLGGSSFDLDINQVAQVSSTSGSNYLGSVGGYSWTSHRQDNIVRRNFVEHGFLFFFVIFRVKHTYCQGIMPMWTRSDRFDYYFPQFAHLGEQPIRKSEIFFDHTGPSTNNDVFAYQEAYQDYRDDMDMVSGCLRPSATNPLSGWTYADYYSSAPSLNSTFIQEDSSNVARSLADPSSTDDQFIYDFTLRAAFTRVMPQNGTPGLVDHY